jgi:hypothetical protein
MKAGGKLHIKKYDNIRSCEIVNWKPERKETNSMFVFGCILQNKNLWVDCFGSERNTDTGSCIFLAKWMIIKFPKIPPRGFLYKLYALETQIK